MNREVLYLAKDTTVTGHPRQPCMLCLLEPEGQAC